MLIEAEKKARHAGLYNSQNTKCQFHMNASVTFGLTSSTIGIFSTFGEAGIFNLRSLGCTWTL